MIKRIIDRIKGKLPSGHKRSSVWPRVRADFLSDHKNCALCGGTAKLEVHHKKPFHLHPELELEPSNLIVLCEAKKSGINCHLFMGHLGNYSSFNEHVDTQAEEWHQRLLNRPKREKPCPPNSEEPLSSKTSTTFTQP